MAGMDRDAIEALRSVDREIGRTEEALDRLYEMLRPGSDRQAVRRTRETCVELGRLRVDAVRAALLSGNADIAERVRAVPARFAEAESGKGRVVVSIEKKRG